MFNSFLTLRSICTYTLAWCVSIPLEMGTPCWWNIYDGQVMRMLKRFYIDLEILVLFFVPMVFQFLNRVRVVCGQCIWWWQALHGWKHDCSCYGPVKPPMEILVQMSSSTLIVNMEGNSAFVMQIFTFTIPFVWKYRMIASKLDATHYYEFMMACKSL